MSKTSQDVFAEQFVRHQGRIYAYIATLLPQRRDAEEVFQQTSLTLWRKWDEYDAERAFVPWACGVAHNVARNFLRSASRSRVTFTDEVLDLLGTEQRTNNWYQDERLEAMRTCLEKLPKSQGEFIEQCYSGRETVVAIAERLGVSTPSLYMKLHRVRQILIDCVERRLAGRGAS